MNTYKILNDFENYFSFTIKGVELYSKMPEYSPRFDATSRKDDWVTPDASFYQSDNYKNPKTAIPDITTWVTGNLVLNQKAYDVLAGKLAISGEFLKVLVGGVEYYIFNTLKVIEDEFINKDKAEEMVEGLSDAVVFKSPTDHVLYTYCTQEFIDILKDNNLKGLLFEEVIVS